MKLLRLSPILAIFALSCSSPTVSNPDANSANAQVTSSESSGSSAGILTSKLLASIAENGSYTTRDSVAAYLCKFEKLPANYRTKSEAKKLYGATGKTFSKWNFNPWETLGVMVGGDTFENREGLLPQDSYRECDVDYSAANRGTKRLVYAKACNIYYTANHYKSFKRIE